MQKIPGYVRMTKDEKFRVICALFEDDYETFRQKKEAIIHGKSDTLGKVEVPASGFLAKLKKLVKI